MRKSGRRWRRERTLGRRLPAGGPAASGRPGARARPARPLTSCPSSARTHPPATSNAPHAVSAGHDRIAPEMACLTSSNRGSRAPDVSSMYRPRSDLDHQGAHAEIPPVKAHRHERAGERSVDRQLHLSSSNARTAASRNQSGVWLASVPTQMSARSGSWSSSSKGPTVVQRAGLRQWLAQRSNVWRSWFADCGRSPPVCPQAAMWSTGAGRRYGPQSPAHLVSPVSGRARLFPRNLTFRRPVKQQMERLPSLHICAGGTTTSAHGIEGFDDCEVAIPI